MGGYQLETLPLSGVHGTAPGQGQAAGAEPGLLTAAQDPSIQGTPLCGDPCRDAMHAGLPFENAAASPSLWNLDLLHSPLAGSGCLGSPLSIFGGDSWLWPPVDQGAMSGAGGDAPVQGPAGFAGDSFANLNLAAGDQSANPPCNFTSNASTVPDIHFHAAPALQCAGARPQAASADGQASQTSVGVPEAQVNGECHPEATPASSLPTALPQLGHVGSGTVPAHGLAEQPADLRATSTVGMEDAALHGGFPPEFDWEDDDEHSDGLQDILQELGLAVSGASGPFHGMQGPPLFNGEHHAGYTGSAVVEHGANGPGIDGSEGKAVEDGASCKSRGTRQRRGKQRGSARTGKENVAPAALKASARPLKAGRPPIAEPVKSRRRQGDCIQTRTVAGAPPACAC